MTSLAPRALLAGQLIISFTGTAFGEPARVPSQGEPVIHARIDTSIAAMLSVRPVLEVGGAKQEIDPRNPFLGARLQSDGSLVISERSSLKFISADGSRVRTVGRRGRGPGEFHQIFDICVFTADSILAVEYGIPLVHVFSPSGGYVRTISPPGWVGKDACFSDGAFLARGTPRPSSSQKAAAIASPLFLVNAVANTQVASAPVEDYGRGYPLPANVVAGGGIFVIGQGNEPAYRVYSRDGRHLRTVKWAEHQRATGARSTGAPFYMLLKSDSQGHVWIQRQTGDGGLSWGVFDGKGAWLGRLDVPRQLLGRTIVPLDGRTALVSWHDEEGFKHVALHRILWRAP